MNALTAIQRQADEFAASLLAFAPPCGSEFVDSVEAAMVAGHEGITVSLPVDHTFTPGLYSRTLLMPAGTKLTSKIHKTEHPFVILEGVISVWTSESGVVTYHAPYCGITKPGTRRILYAHTDTRWITFHPTNETDLAVIEDQLIMKHSNPLLPGGAP